jgi:hypothetical protein
MEKLLKKLPLKIWQKATADMLKNFCLEEAWLDQEQNLLGGAFDGPSSVDVYIQMNASQFKFSCSHCTGKFCPHASALVGYFLDDASSFLPWTANSKLINSLAKVPWQAIAVKVRKKNLPALRKKIETMLEGLLFAKELLLQIFQVLPKQISVEELYGLRLQIDRLSEFYLPGLMAQFKELLSSTESSFFCFGQLQEAMKEIELKLESQLSDPDYAYDDSEAYAYFGHIWKVDELREVSEAKSGRFMQLSFFCSDNTYAERLEDTAIWLNLEDGEVSFSQNLRPFKSLRHLKQEDSDDCIHECAEYFSYPGSVNRRIRWQSVSTAEEMKEDFETAMNFAEVDWPGMLKKVKNRLLEPLALCRPLILLKFEKIIVAADGYYLQSQTGEIIELSSPSTDSLDTLSPLLRSLSETSVRNAAMLLEFSYDQSSDKLSGRPLCLLNSYEKIRFV